MNYQKVWNTMNNLELVTSKICSAREIIDCAITALEEHKYEKAESMINAADEFLAYYLQEFDSKFKDAWNETVVKVKKEDLCMTPWGHSDLEYLCKNKEPHRSTDSQYTEEELNAMCDKAKHDEELKKISEEGGYEWTSQKKSLTYDQATSLGWKMTDDGFWIPPKESEEKKKVKKWILPVDVDGLTGDCFVNFPDDLLEAANLVEGDEVYFIDNGNGTYTIRKVTKPLKMDEC